MAKNIAHLYEYIIRKHVEFNLHLCITIVSMRYLIQFYSDAIFVFAYKASNRLKFDIFLHLFFDLKLQVIVPLVVMCCHGQFHVMNHLQKCL